MTPRAREIAFGRGWWMVDAEAVMAPAPPWPRSSSAAVWRRFPVRSWCPASRPVGARPPWCPLPEHPNTSPPEPSGPRYSARVALTCERAHAPGQVLHAVQKLRSVIDDRLRGELGDRYDRHRAESVGADKLAMPPRRAARRRAGEAREHRVWPPPHGTRSYASK